MNDASQSEPLSSTEIGDSAPTAVTPSGTEGQRFIQACSEWYRGWLDANDPILQSNGISNTQVVILIRSVAPDVERAEYDMIGSDTEIVFKAAYDANSEGVILATENLRKMVKIRDGFKSISQALGVCLDIPADTTFVLIPLAQRKMMLHLGGEVLETWCQHPPEVPMRNSTDELSVERIEADIFDFHYHSLKVAASRISRQIWVGPSKPYKLVSNPEQAIQSYLFTALHHGYRHLQGIVDEETVGKGGRCDIRVQWPNAIGPHKYTSVMIELKVLSHGRGDTYHRNWVWKGVEQADRYRRLDTAGVFACIFDGRKNQSDQMPELTPKAEAMNVNLRWYQMEAPVGSAWDDSSATASSGSTGDASDGTDPAAASGSLSVDSNSVAVASDASSTQ
ncbi:hypothetical protein [Stenotrophomonas maltophilia]|uniref:hypothetical protein n=1 Tax=Stenotrophomonas maltophilia TaxID=40324 RepID=UPI0039C2A07D